MTTTARGDRIGSSRRALLFALGSISWIPGSAATATILFADEGWYRERPEPEQERAGVLRKTEPPQGPNSRSALRYVFRTKSESLAVYAPSGVSKLDGLVGIPVTARGKLVDLRSEGFGLEFWIGSIRTE